MRITAFLILVYRMSRKLGCSDIRWITIYFLCKATIVITRVYGRTFVLRMLARVYKVVQIA